MYVAREWAVDVGALGNHLLIKTSGESVEWFTFQSAVGPGGILLGIWGESITELCNLRGEQRPKIHDLDAVCNRQNGFRKSITSKLPVYILASPYQSVHILTKITQPTLSIHKIGSTYMFYRSWWPCPSQMFRDSWFKQWRLNYSVTKRSPINRLTGSFERKQRALRRLWWLF